MNTFLLFKEKHMLPVMQSYSNRVFQLLQDYPVFLTQLSDCILLIRRLCLQLNVLATRAVTDLEFEKDNLLSF